MSLPSINPRCPVHGVRHARPVCKRPDPEPSVCSGLYCGHPETDHGPQGCSRCDCTAVVA